MNIFKRISVFLVASILILSGAFAATATLQPSSVPINAELNTSDGDQYYVQSLLFKLDADGSGSWSAGDSIVVNLPEYLSIADVDDDGNWVDEVSGAIDVSNAGMSLNIEASNSSTIELRLDGGAASTGDSVMTFFPVRVKDHTIADSTTRDYDIVYGDGTFESTEPNPTVTYITGIPDYITFAAEYSVSGGISDTSSKRGKFYPSAKKEAMDSMSNKNVTLLLPSLVEDLDSASVDSANWHDINLDSTETTPEVKYTLWASKKSDLNRVKSSPSTQIPKVVEQPDEGLTTNPGQECDIVPDSAYFSNTLLDGTNLEEGTWYFYVTSNVTSDWVLGQSDSVEIRHQPVFHYSDGEFKHAGAGGVLDYADLGTYDLSTNGVDDTTGMYLDSGGGVGVNGKWKDDPSVDARNTENVDIHWEVDDIDDNAEVSIYISTESDLTTKSELMANAQEIGSDDLMEEANEPGQEADEYNFDINPPDSPYIEEGDYTVYLSADDGKNSNVYKVTRANGDAYVLHVMHFPYLSFQSLNENMINIYDSTENKLVLNSAKNKRFTINWGEKTTDDRDIDGNASIDLYAIDKELDDSDYTGYDVNVESVDETALPNSVTDPDAEAVHIASLKEDPDTRSDNRYSWDFRNSGMIPDSSFNIFALIQEGDDAQIVEYADSTDGNFPGYNPDADNFTFKFEIKHGTYILTKNPVEDKIVRLKGSDKYQLRWKAVDKDDSDIPGLVALVPDSVDSSIVDTSDISNNKDHYWLTTNSSGQYHDSSVVNIKNEKYTADFGGITVDAAGNTSTPPQGDYNVYYLYDDADNNNLSSLDAVKAAGKVHINRYDDLAKDFELSPNRITAEKGDTITLDVYLEAKTENENIISVGIDVPTSKLSIVDQDENTSGIQPWNNESENFNGSELKNEVVENDSISTIAFEEYDGDDITAGVVTIGYIELVVDSGNVDYEIDDEKIDFVTSGENATQVADEDGNIIAETVPEVAANLQIASYGMISGEVDIQGRDNEGQQVTLKLVEEGSVEPITGVTSLDTLDENTSEPGIQYTLGAEGTYQMSGVPTGTYDLICKKKGWLNQRKASIDVRSFSKARNIDFEGSDKLLAGDCAGYAAVSGEALPDNQITSGDDGDEIKTAYGSTPGDDNWNEYADFTGDDYIGFDDLNYEQVNSGVDQGNGEGLLYKKSSGSNEDAVMGLKKSEEIGDKVTYVVKVDKSEDVRAYKVEMNIDHSNWKVVNYNDKLAEGEQTYNFKKSIDGDMHFVSAIGGPATRTESNVKLAEITLERKKDNADKPAIYNAKLINSANEVTEATLQSELKPDEFSLSQNYPNPFNPTTNIKFALPKAGKVKLTIYNLMGQKVKTLVSETMDEGRYKVKWNSTNESGIKVSSGVYFYRLQVSGRIVNSKKMILMK